MQSQVEQMIEKLEHLSPDRLEEVADFIDFLQYRDQENKLRLTFSKASEESFTKIWDNDDDTIYDSF